jgi:hypothetical protein
MILPILLLIVIIQKLKILKSSRIEDIEFIEDDNKLDEPVNLLLKDS